MWGLIGFSARLASRYLLPRRWTRYVLLAGVVLFSILTALLIDARLYWTAGMAAVCTMAGLILLAVQFLQGLREKAEHKQLQQENEARRAAAAAARAEKIEKARVATVDVATGLTNRAATLADVARGGATNLAGATKVGAAGLADATKKGFDGARDRLSAWRGKPDAQ